MALEKQVKEGMPAKQKGMIAAVVIIILVVIWQAMGLVGGGGSVPPPPKPSAKQSAANKTAEMTNNAASPNNQAAQTEVRQAQVVSDARFVQLQQMSEEKYIGKINELENLKIQRAIAETNQGIAAARLATATAEKNITDLLTRPTIRDVSAGTYANKLTNPAMQGESVTSSLGTAVLSAVPQVDYTVISVSMQLGKWSAVLGYQGKLYSVSVGDVFSLDNSVVTHISKNGVVLEKDGKSRKISIMSAI